MSKASPMNFGRFLLQCGHGTSFRSNSILRLPYLCIFPWRYSWAGVAERDLSFLCQIWHRDEFPFFYLPDLADQNQSFLLYFCGDGNRCRRQYYHRASLEEAAAVCQSPGRDIEADYSRAESRSCLFPLRPHLYRLRHCHQRFSLRSQKTWQFSFFDRNLDCRRPDRGRPALSFRCCGRGLTRDRLRYSGL